MINRLICLLMASCSFAPADEPIFLGQPELVVEGAGEGPAWHPELGLLFSGGGGIQRYSRDGKLSIYRQDAGTNGLLFDLQGRLLSCEPVRRVLSRTEKDGTLNVLAERFQGQRFNQPNDVTIDSRGRIYFSDPQYGPRDKMELVDDSGRTVEGVYRIDRNGQVTRIITHQVDRPNGVLVTSDDRSLYVADNNNNSLDDQNNVIGNRKLWRFDLQDDGTVDENSRKLIFDWTDARGPDGMAQDTAGADLRGWRLDQAQSAVRNQSPPGRRLRLLPRRQAGCFCTGAARRSDQLQFWRRRSTYVVHHCRRHFVERSHEDPRRFTLATVTLLGEWSADKVFAQRRQLTKRSGCGEKLRSASISAAGGSDRSCLVR